MSKAKFIGIDPSLTNTGIVCLDHSGKVLFSETIKTDSHGKSRQGLFDRWQYIADQAHLTFVDQLKPSMFNTFLIYAPVFLHGKGASNSLLPCVNGIMYGLARNYTSHVLWRDDSHVRSVLRQVGYNVPKSKNKKSENKGAMTRFVRQYWKECPNSHEADSWCAAKYLTL